MSRPTCATCRFAQIDINDDEDTIGYGEPRAIGTCQRFPIRAKVEIARRWCGEYVPTLPELDDELPALPDGWEWEDISGQTGAVMTNARRHYCIVYDSGRVAAAGAPLGVVNAVAAAHLAGKSGGRT